MENIATKTEPDLTVTFAVSMGRGRLGRGTLDAPKTPKRTSPQEGSLPRVTRLMALAIKLAGDLDAGRIRDLADIARLGRITRARATQIMNLLTLAPDIQEAILFLPPTTSGRAPITERALRDLARLSWPEQRVRWDHYRAQRP